MTFGERSAIVVWLYGAAFLACPVIGIVLVLAGSPVPGLIVLLVGTALFWNLRRRALDGPNSAVAVREGYAVDRDGWVRSGNPNADQFMNAWWTVFGSLEAGPKDQIGEYFAEWQATQRATGESAEAWLRNADLVVDKADFEPASAAPRARIRTLGEDILAEGAAFQVSLDDGVLPDAKGASWLVVTAARIVWADTRNPAETDEIRFDRVANFRCKRDEKGVHFVTLTEEGRATSVRFWTPPEFRASAKLHEAILSGISLLSPFAEATSPSPDSTDSQDGVGAG